MNKILLPILRKMIPQTLAESIVSVQPMDSSVGGVFVMRNDKVAFKNYYMVPNQNECVLYDTPECTYYAIDVRPEVDAWIKEQPIHMWKYAEETDGCHFSFTRYIISEGLLSWLILRWS